MSKISLVIQREYLSRVKNRAFILTTILTPLVFVGFIFGAAILSIKGKEKLKIAVVDDNGFFRNNLKSDSDLVFEFPANVDTLNYADKGYSAFLHITPIASGDNKDTFIVRSHAAIGVMTSGSIEDKLNGIIEDNMLQKAGIERHTLDSIHQSSHIANIKTVEDDNGKVKESNQGLAMAVGYVAGIIIYITMLIYGMMLMRGVMEEKTSRIAEVIVSSVKPFDLMMGKIIGIGAVGLTQFIMWIGLIIIFFYGAQAFLPHTAEHVQAMQQQGTMPGAAAMHAAGNSQFMDNLNKVLASGNWPVILACFVFYFLAGYLFYAALFAAIGCVVEDIQSSQSLTLPVTMPIIFSFIIGTNAVQVPGSAIAVWASIIPFSSPIVMMCRVGYGIPGTVPYWQLFASILALVGGFLFNTWLAGKIYRTGILMYGKKTTWKEMFRWAFRRN
ncbi:MAG TPA: ABC transporter permease [Chitinophagaceae bacterium]|nr:ABC transporter permease [Chitinophagaceae bacterium]